MLYFFAAFSTTHRLMLARTIACASARSAAAAPRILAASRTPLAQRWLGTSTFLQQDDVTDRVLGCVKNFQKVDPSIVSVQSHFLNDLGLDSLDTVEVVMAFEDEFVIEIPDADAEKILTCSDAINYIMQNPNAK